MIFYVLLTYILVFTTIVFGIVVLHSERKYLESLIDEGGIKPDARNKS